MIRKGTWIVLVVFAALLGLAFYLSKNPLPTQPSTALTPSATAQPALLGAWQSTDITFIELAGKTENFNLTLQVNGGWTLSPDNNKPVDAGKVENLRTELAAVRVMTSMSPAISLSNLGLDNPSDVITLRNKQGQQLKLHLGSATPTQTGYYVQVNNQTPVVIDKGSVDNILALLQKSQLVVETPTPTAKPGVGGTPEATATPTP